MTTLLAAFLLAAQPASPPPALDPPVKASYRAYRAPDCSTWRTVRTGRGALPMLEAAYNIWFHGYVSGFNAHGPEKRGDVLGTATWAELGGFIDRYCALNPDHSAADAFPPLMADLMKRPAAPPVAAPTRRARLTVTTTCRDWIRGRGDPLLRLTSGGAVRGYLTAYNRWGPDPAGDLLGPGNDPLIDSWVDSWCARRPSALLLQSVAPSSPISPRSAPPADSLRGRRSRTRRSSRSRRAVARAFGSARSPPVVPAKAGIQGHRRRLRAAAAAIML